MVLSSEATGQCPPEITSTAELQLEELLHEGAPLFAASREQWQAVQAGMTALRATCETVNEGSAQGARPPLVVREVLELTRAGAACFYLDAQQARRAEAPPDELWKSWLASKDGLAMLASHRLVSAEANHSIHHAQVAAGLEYARAFQTDDLALDEIANWLSDDKLTLPLLDQLDELLDAPHEAPLQGLLELLANDLHGGQRNVLGEAIARATQDPREFAFDFIWQLQLPGVRSFERGWRKELSLAAEMIALYSEVLTSEFGQSDDEVAALLVLHQDEWPEPFLYLLESYATVQSKRLREETANRLRPYVKTGRQPIRKQLQPDQAVGAAKKSKRRPTGKEPKAPSKDLEQLASATPETPPIARFGVIKNGEGSRRFVETVDSFEALMEQSCIKDFLSKYRSEKGLEPAIRATITRLAAEPFNPVMCKRMSGKAHKFEEGMARRRGWRCTMRRAPGVSGSQLINQTRIFYDVLQVQGEWCLAIREVAIKADVVKVMGGMR